MLRRTFTGLAAALVTAPVGTSAQTPLPARTLTHELECELLFVPEYTVFDWVKVEMLPAGGVALRGQATNKAKTAILARLRQMPGAENLADEIETLPNGYNDVRLRFRLFSALFNTNSALLRYATRAMPPIHIVVKQGRVTLKGEVAQMAESMLAALRARGVRGVRSLKNELRILPLKHAQPTTQAATQPL